MENLSGWQSRQDRWIKEESSQPDMLFPDPGHGTNE
jgi:hypothetical protein